MSNNDSQYVTTGEGFMGQIKNILPIFLLQPIQRVWRRYYWWQRYRISPGKNKNIINSLVASGKPIKLELGSGKRDEMEGWVFSDINGSGDVQLDFTKPLPFPDNSVEMIYSSHILEHFSYPHPMIDLLRECYRILEPGGKFSIAVPNARIFIDAYINDEGFSKDKYCSYDVGLTYKSKIDYVNFIAHLGGEHKHLFDEEGLIAIIEDAGFHEIKLREYSPPVDLKARKHESIYAEGVK